jgi:hypothetical protein
VPAKASLPCLSVGLSVGLVQQSTASEQPRQVVTFHRGITTFCRCLMLFQTALQARAFDHSATCPVLLSLLVPSA